MGAIQLEWESDRDMTDRVSEILRAHKRLAESQLELVGYGVDFSVIEEGDSTAVIPTSEDGLLRHIAQLERLIRAHDERMRAA